MKKIYIMMAVLATALLSSCVQEKSFKDITMGENEIAFVMQGASTRSAEVSTEALRGITIPLGTVDGERVFLEETVENLNPSPATRGVPVYNENLGSFSLGVYVDGEFKEDVTYQNDEELVEGGWRYHHNYVNKNPWPANDQTADFYLRMPAVLNGVEFTKRENLVTTFTLESPENGKNQQDIVFGQLRITESEHDAKRPNGYPVTMKHALTGIKFRNGHPNQTMTKTIITKVEMIGLVQSATGTIASDGTVTWVPGEGKSTAEAPFYLEFANPTYTPANGANNVDGTITYDNGTVDPETGKTVYGDNSKFANTSWTAAAADRNLNNANGELTFWFIPQEVPDDLILKVYFRVKTPDTPNGTEIPHTIKLGELLNSTYQEAGNTGNLEWKAGQLRTYTLKPYDVDVEIEDVMEDDYTKTGLHVANTGNVDEYVRMLIMGNWYGWRSDQNPTTDEPSILVGYKYKGDEEGLTEAQKKEMIKPWFREGYDGVDPYGTFDSSFLLAKLGERDGKAGDWADASGGFYYTLPIGPGSGVGETVASATKDLFDSYTVDPAKIPTIYITKPGSLEREPAVGVHLVMEIVIQAIAVPTVTVTNSEGTTTTKNVWWLQAWYEATKVDKLDPTADRNAAYVTIWKSGAYGDSIYVEE